MSENIRHIAASFKISNLFKFLYEIGSRVIAAERSEAAHYS